MAAESIPQQPPAEASEPEPQEDAGDHTALPSKAEEEDLDSDEEKLVRSYSSSKYSSYTTPRDKYSSYTTPRDKYSSYPNFSRNGQHSYSSSKHSSCTTTSDKYSSYSNHSDNQRS
ncbi:hypothetical protein AAES_165352 [Amazona aestiva]|uniref:Uncharacterized protein n=1 Tax=Amazona aestiva TaxID=12930 RepID=A0A0Q3UPR4_AMAAE|nr:hypothetical protein AAES_165352 [Amazona aestiva]